MYPSDEASFEKVVQHNLAFRQSCLDLSGSPLFDFMDTISIVKDHEAVRKALGGEPISWLGESYGTQLGTQYAELFPDSFRAMILDCSVSISQSQTSLFIESAATVETTFRYFLEWCEKQNTTLCPLANRNQTPEEIWTQLLTRARKSPIPALVCQTNGTQCVIPTVTDEQLIKIAWGNLYNPVVQFPFLAQGIYNASYHNDASAFAAISASSQTLYSISYHYANVAITCHDNYHNASSYVDIQYQKILGKSETPLMYGYSAEVLFESQCYGLPPPSRNPPHVISIPHSDNFPTVLMLANVYDPATPMAWSVNLRDEIGRDRAVLATRIAAGHTVYFQPDAFNSPAVLAMNDYLLNLIVPPQGIIFTT